ncbi:541_t:CDS:2 [Diversispora eburnea]|uniref:541_t:CDS:1 n=1 Tax=Diversispora eburnea TaxID=1213867 RepID=A0A9N9GC74_9GLOM|nr:541_t:CDS:2 [Diversispora eburnea]
MYAKELKGGSKKVSEWYRIGTQKCNKIWNKFEKVNTSPEPTPQIDILKKPDIAKPDPIEVKRMRKQGEME